MKTLSLVLAVASGFFLVLSWLFRQKRKQLTRQIIPASLKEKLQKEVVFYQQLDEAGKNNFEQRVQQFLSTVNITGVKTTVEDIDKVLIGASAIIPIFAFPEWEYVNLHEVLLYPDSFSNEFAQQGEDRNILGMVGEGALQHVMVISQNQLRQDFLNKTGKTNTAIHEFVHLVDKTDGSTDGIPEAIIQHPYITPWLNMMHEEIRKIMSDHSDINPYGATNEAEFLAVVSEYFFERPELLKEKHPELYALLSKIFRKQ